MKKGHGPGRLRGVYNVTVTVIPGTCVAGATCTGNIEAFGHETFGPFRGFEEISTASDNERVLLLVGVSKGDTFRARYRSRY